MQKPDLTPSQNQTKSDLSFHGSLHVCHQFETLLVILADQLELSLGVSSLSTFLICLHVHTFWKGMPNYAKHEIDNVIQSSIPFKEMNDFVHGF